MGYAIPKSRKAVAMSSIRCRPFQRVSVPGSASLQPSHSSRAQPPGGGTHGEAADRAKPRADDQVADLRPAQRAAALRVMRLHHRVPRAAVLRAGGDGVRSDRAQIAEEAGEGRAAAGSARYTGGARRAGGNTIRPCRSSARSCLRQAISRGRPNGSCQSSLAQTSFARR